MTEIRKGDLVALVTEHKDWVIGVGAMNVRYSVELVECASATRDGVVKTIRSLNDGANAVKPYPWSTCMLVAGVDRDALVAAWMDRRWPSRPDEATCFPPPFDSVDECREFVRPFRVNVAA